MSDLASVSKYRHLWLPGQLTIHAKLVHVRNRLARVEKPKQANQGFTWDHCSDSSGLGSMVRAGLPGPSISPASPFIPSLKPRKPAPSLLPSSGSLFPPKSTNAMTANK
jgi:hypothetical protein